MSWDVFVWKFDGPPPSMAEFQESHLQPLGSPESIRQSISKLLPDVDWSDPTWGVFQGDGFAFEFNLGAEEPVKNFMVHVHGTGNAIAALMPFAVANGWTLFDCTTTEFLDPINPSDEGWKRFQAFRDKTVAGDNGGNRESG